MPRTSPSLIAFLRGINLGKRQVKMAQLKAALESCGYTKIVTVIASGNVVCDPPERGDAGRANSQALIPQTAHNLETCLSSAFGFPFEVILRTPEQIRALVDSDPFAGLEETPQSRRYVSFLPAEPEWTHPLPHDFPGGHTRLVRIAGGDICSVVTLLPGINSTDAMGVLEKTFGNKITTRNWNTIHKILAVLDR